MALRPGTNVGPYRIDAPIGAGGMGEVYRARDARLGRDVALKVISSETAMGADHLARFEREARAVAALNHPNILAVFDVGAVEGAPYVVFELLEGETLRDRLGRGALPVRKVVELGIQVCRGLAAAHARGIVHRDLKPANLFLTGDGQVKILDFGLARETGAGKGDVAEADTASVTAAGVVVGTPAYMSPEQARGQSVDARSDLFSLGAILYEMFTGRRAFEGVTAMDVLTGVLMQDPGEMSTPSGVVPPVLERVVRRCLEKDPEERFQSARDVGFALDAASGTTPSTLTPVVGPAPRRRRWMRVALLAAGLLAMGALGLLLGRSFWERPLPRITQLTSRNGYIDAARWTSDGQTIVYSTFLDGRPPEIFAVRLDSPEPRSLGLPPAHLMGVSSQGELAILLTPLGMIDETPGTLARVPFAGGEPRPILENVLAADWSPDGRDLAVLRVVDGDLQLEYPIGKVLGRFDPLGGTHLRVSPRGDRVLLSHYFGAFVFDRAGKGVRLAVPQQTGGAAWAGNDTVWILAGEQLHRPSLWKVTVSGVAREVYANPGPTRILDASAGGRLLVSQGIERAGTRAKTGGQGGERELRGGSLSDLSGDGTRALLYRGTNPSVQTCLEPTRGGPVVRLGEGWGRALSPDGRWVLTLPPTLPPSGVSLVPTGPGETRALSVAPVVITSFAFWFLDDAHVVFVGKEPDRKPRGYVIELPGGAVRAITPEETVPIPHSLADGHLLCMARGGTLARYPASGGEGQPLKARVPAGVTPLRVSSDGRFLLVRRPGIPCRVERLDLTTGQSSPWRVLQPDDMVGVTEIWDPVLTADGDVYAYTYMRKSFDLYLLDGLR